MKILHIGAADSSGGVLNYIRTLEKHSDSKNFEFHRLVSPQLLETLEDKDFILHGGGINYRVSTLLASVKNLRTLLQKEYFDVIHLHATRAGFVGCLAARGLPIKVIYTGHGFCFEGKQSPFSRFIWKQFEKYILKSADLTTFLSGREASFAVNHGLVNPDKSRVINTRIDSVPLKKQNTEVMNKVCNDYGFDKNSFVVGSVGALDERKDPFSFVHIAYKVIKEKPNSCFIWIGGGVLHEAVVDLVEKMGMSQHIIFTGQISHEKVPFLLKAFDVFLLTSKHEALPLCVLEANSLKIPVVSAAYPGVEAVIEDGVTGRLFPINDLPCAFRCINSFRDDSEYANSISENAFDVYRAIHYDSSIMAEQYYTIYDELTALK
jgi:glycosyltransferase involved in cell wall biosynthesis